MYRSVVYSLLRFALRPLVSATRGELRSIPRPVDQPRSHAWGPSPDRILLFGGELAIGRGVLSHDMALSGHLARHFSPVTMRGVDIDVVADEDMTVALAIDVATTVRFEMYDLIVVTLGLQDSLAMTPLGIWRRSMEDLLTEIRVRARPMTQIFVVQAMDARIFSALPMMMTSLAGKHAALLNRQTLKAVAEIEGVVYLPFTPREIPADGIALSDLYREWARQIAAPLIAALELRHTSGASELFPVVRSESDRQSAVDQLKLVDTEPEERFDGIVRTARTVFNTESASFALIDHDRQWHKARVGIETTQSPRADSLCNVTITEHSGLIVGDASKDARFKDSPLVTGAPFIRFYAGYPVEGPDGSAVGSLCVFDPVARDVNPDDLTFLREFALLIERELWARANPGPISEQIPAA